MTPRPYDLPAHDELADFMDADDWNRELHGRFADFAELPVPDVEVHEQEVTPGALHDEASA